MTRVSLSEFKALKALAAGRKKKRMEKAKTLWPKRVKKARTHSKRKRLIATLDAIFSIWVRLRGKARTGGMCELCGKRPIETCFHCVSRGDYATRWLPENAVASCRGCNFEETFRKRKYRDLHISKVGLAERERLEEMARTKTHFSDADLEVLIGHFRNRIKAGDYDCIR